MGVITSIFVFRPKSSSPRFIVASAASSKLPVNSGIIRSNFTTFDVVFNTSPARSTKGTANALRAGAVSATAPIASLKTHKAGIRAGLNSSPATRFVAFHSSRN